MKKIPTLLLLSVAPLFSVAQTFRGQSEVSVSYGFRSFQEVSNGEFGLGDEDSYVTEDYSTGNLFLTDRYYLSNRLAIGLTAGRIHFNTSFHQSQGSYAVESSSSSFDYTTIAPEVLFNYINTRYVRLYTLLGTGYSIVSEKTTEYFPFGQPAVSSSVRHTPINVYYSPIGLSIGGQVSGFLELGIGYKGFVNAGLSFRLPYHDPVTGEKYRDMKSKKHLQKVQRKEPHRKELPGND